MRIDLFIKNLLSFTTAIAFIFPLFSLVGCGQKNVLSLTASSFSEKDLYRKIKKAYKNKNYEDVISEAEIYLEYFPYSSHAQDVFYMLAISYKKFIFGPEYDPHFAKKLYDLSNKYLLLYPHGKYKKEFQKFKHYAKKILFEHKYIIIKEEIKRDNFWAALDRLYHLCNEKEYREFLLSKRKEFLNLFANLKPKAIAQIDNMIKSRQQKIKDFKKKIKNDPKRKKIYQNWINLLEGEINYLKNKKEEVRSLSCSL